MIVFKFLQYSICIVFTREAYHVPCSPRDSVNQHHTHTQVTIHLQAEFKKDSRV